MFNTENSLICFWYLNPHQKLVYWYPNGKMEKKETVALGNRRTLKSKENEAQ